jgi:hypothetical protein
MSSDIHILDPARKPVFDLATLRRYSSMPWLLILILCGIMPWCSVWDAVPSLTTTQSGYQALYGGTSPPSPYESQGEIGSEFDA